MYKSKENPTKTYGKKEGVDFIVPYILWVYLQLTSSHKERKTAERYTENLPFNRMILSRTDRDNDHPNAHWVEVLKKYWQQYESYLCRLIFDALKMAEKEDIMNIEPLLPYSDVILYLGE